MIIVKCPKCKHNMKYEPQKGRITKKNKRCVYCGYTFKVHSNIEKSRIIKIEK
ncbi:MAG: hypothetical protein KatS3mg002_0640 [Candidatus Woesearchaeota archaeon]|nr:MAG: hypothetical protein KatS3mg002_0640 [Candidatus Woesearchaeota archaeon]